MQHSLESVVVVPKWIPATINKCSGPLSYTVLVGKRQVMRRHVEQIRRHKPSKAPKVDSIALEESCSSTVQIPIVLVPKVLQTPQKSSLEVGPVQPRVSVSSSPKPESEPAPAVLDSTAPTLRCSTRERRQPDFFRF